MQPIHLFNTLGKTKQEFTPINKDLIKLYSCGPTVYNYAHIGNLRAYVFSDTLKRVLKYNGYNVKHIMNITDVGHLSSDADDGDDKMVKALKREGKEMSIENMRAVANFYFEKFKEDIEKLNIELPDKFPFASDHIKEDVKMIETLLDKGCAYTTSDGIYFDTSKDEYYGKLGGISQDNEYGRINTNTEKKNYRDFALWKFATDKDLGFEASFACLPNGQGTGFPGWHIECSAMIEQYLGTPIDIHTGGIDHIPVHHNNEIAQTECATGHALSNFWMHNAHITIIQGEDTYLKTLRLENNTHECPKCNHENLMKSRDSYIIKESSDGYDLFVSCSKCHLEFHSGFKIGKMAKSGENFLTLKTLGENGVHSLAYRYWLLTARYSTRVDYSLDAIKASQVAYEKLQTYINGLDGSQTTVNIEYRDKFLEAINNDLDTPKALVIVWELVKDTGVSDADKKTTLLDFDKVLGLMLGSVIKENIEIPEDVQKLIDARKLARENKDWSKADELRLEIQAKGFEIKD